MPLEEVWVIIVEIEVIVAEQSVQVLVDRLGFVFLRLPELFQGEMWELSGVLFGTLFEETLLVSRQVEVISGTVSLCLWLWCHGVQGVVTGFFSSERVEVSSLMASRLSTQEPESRLKGLEVLLIFASCAELSLLSDLIFNLLAMRVTRWSA